MAGGSAGDAPSGTGAAGEESGDGGAGTPAPPSGCRPSQSVLSDHIPNARDLGGVALSPGSQVGCGWVFRGGPLRVSGDGCQAANELGLRTIIDLRIAGESQSTPDADCVDATRVAAPLPIPYGLGPADYLRDLNETASIAIAFHTFGDADAYPIYFHCTYGRDRTGVVGALLLLTLGATRQTVMDEYMLSQASVGAYPESLNAVLDEIERRGGPVTVLKEAGISDAEIAVMRGKAVEID
jgi:hypothetical protein